MFSCISIFPLLRIVTGRTYAIKIWPFVSAWGSMVDSNVKLGFPPQLAGIRFKWQMKWLVKCCHEEKNNAYTLYVPVVVFFFDCVKFREN